MLYTLGPEPGPASRRVRVHDRRVRYRPRPRAASAPRRLAPEDPSDRARDPRDSADSEQALRIAALSAELSVLLGDEARAIWLALDEAQHGHWLAVAVNHYNMGYDAGRAQTWLDSTALWPGSSGPSDTLPEKLRCLATILAQLVAELEVAD
jgi:hypothetical protein